MNKYSEHNHKEATTAKTGVWLKRIGVVGFTFFLVKGLFWLAIFLGIGKMF